jgi:ATP-dependent helicase/nuclease subunit A
VHGSNRQGEPGLVELWPAREAEKHIEKDAFEPVDATPVDAPSMLLARRTARRIRYWKDSHACFEDDGAPITPGDVLVLVRNRGPLFDGVIKALKKEGVPVAGADRMTLNEQIVVLDLLALGRFCLLPEDDLNLAALLKSPLIGLDDEALESIAHGRGDISLWAALQRRGGEAPYAAAVVRLTEWQALARRFDPYGFYGEVLSAGHGRRDLLARLGVDAEEAINVFLATLRQWQASHPPSLLGFVEAMAANDSDVKRDMEEAHGRVRVMTVHASKGLEARIVFLIDTAHNPKGGGNSGPKLLEIDEGDVETAVWVKGEKSDPPALAPARERANEAAMAESRRLLYVALTRARDRLYIGTAQGQKAPPDGHWRGMIDAALTGHANLREVQAEDGEGPVQQWRSTQNPRIKPPVEAETVKSRPDHPNWLMQRPERKDLPRPPPLRPSRLVDAAEPPPLRDGVTARVNARLRGDLIHHLLQHLPDVASARRQIVAERLASARFPALDASLRAESIADTLSLMAEPSLLPLFEGEGRNEVEIAGEVTIGGRKAEVAGRIDRLSVTADSVTLVDYKTGRPPKDATAVPESHLQQLAIYEMLLRDLYPDRVITTAIIWTVLPEIVVIPPVDLSRARDSITLP